MSQNSRGLGRGLDSLIPTRDDEGEKSADIPTNELKIVLIKPNPHQPRRHFDEGSLKELADSIKEHGVIQPIIVSKEGKDFILIAGERRLRAAKLAGLDSVPVILRSTKEQQKVELALIENIQREDLNVLEEASSYKKLLDEFSLTQDEISKKVGKSRSAVANAIRLLSLPVEVKKGLKAGLITEGHARVILSLPTIERQIAFYNDIVSGKLNVRQAEVKVKSGVSSKSFELDTDTKNIVEQIAKVLNTKVNIQKKGSGGKIIIEYYSDEELERIVDKLKNKS